MDWLRWHNGTVTDPKWRVIAKRAGVPLHMVVAVWPMVLEAANQSSERGTLESFDPEDVAAALDLEPGQVEAILEAMQGKVLDGAKLSGWDKRNPKREDGSAERARAWREKRKRERAEANAPERKRTLDKSRGEESSTDTGAKAPAAAPPVENSPTPDERRPPEEPAVSEPEPEPDPAEDRKALLARVAPLIRKHLWQSRSPPEGKIDGRGITMERELSAAEQLAAKYSPDELCGAIESARDALEVPPGRKISLLHFQKSDKQQLFHLCVAHWRSLAAEDAGADLDAMLAGIGTNGGHP